MITIRLVSGDFFSGPPECTALLNAFEQCHSDIDWDKYEAVLIRMSTGEEYTNLTNLTNDNTISDNDAADLLLLVRVRIILRWIGIQTIGCYRAVISNPQYLRHQWKLTGDDKYLQKIVQMKSMRDIIVPNLQHIKDTPELFSAMCSNAECVDLWIDDKVTDDIKVYEYLMMNQSDDVRTLITNRLLTTHVTKKEWDNFSANPSLVDLFDTYSAQLTHHIAQNTNPDAYPFASQVWRNLKILEKATFLNILSNNPELFVAMVSAGEFTDLPSNLVSFLPSHEASYQLICQWEKINWSAMSACPHPDAIARLSTNLRKINLMELARNRNPIAIELLETILHSKRSPRPSLDMSLVPIFAALSLNPCALPVLKRNRTWIHWNALCYNTGICGDV